MGLFGNLFDKGNSGILKEFSYSPGYCDMLGAYHSSALKRNENGEWVFITRDRENHSDPVSVKTFKVPDGKAEAFEAFIKEKNFISLSKRPKSDLFVTDYSPWHFGVDLDCSASGGSHLESYRIDQYKEYSKADNDLMDQVKAMFCALKGGLISEVKETG